MATICSVKTVICCIVVILIIIAESFLLIIRVFLPFNWLFRSNHHNMTLHPSSSWLSFSIEIFLLLMIALVISLWLISLSLVLISSVMVNRLLISIIFIILKLENWLINTKGIIVCLCDYMIHFLYNLINENT